jgi:CRISPR-associated protein Cas1
VHEDASSAFSLDVADLWRASLTLPLAFSVAAKAMRGPPVVLEREVRYQAAKWFKDKHVIPSMIDQIKELLHVDDDDRDA